MTGNKSKVVCFEVLLATTYSLYVNTQKFHWNVKGINFYALHQFSEILYRRLAEDIDAIAERIRFAGQEVDSGFLEFQGKTKIKNSIVVTRDCVKSLEMLSQNWQVFLEVIKNAIDSAHGDDGVLTFLTDLLNVHEKNHWLIKSHIA